MCASRMRTHAADGDETELSELLSLIVRWSQRVIH